MTHYREIRTEKDPFAPKTPRFWDGKAAQRIAEIINSLKN